MKQSTDKKYKISKYLKLIPDQRGVKTLIYHSLFGNASLISPRLAKTLNDHQGGIFKPNSFSIPQKITDDLHNQRLLLDDPPENRNEITDNETNHRNRPKIGHLRLCISENCNMCCTYCYVRCKKQTANMSYEIAEKAIRGYYLILKKHNHQGSITFFGGEPFLNWNVLKRTITLISQLDPKRSLIRNVQLTSNGTLINSSKVDFLRTNRVGISISIDGAKEVNDKIRIMKNRKSSYDKIIKGIELLTKDSYKPTSLVCTIGDHNVDHLEELIKLASEKKLSLTINDAFAEPRKKLYNFSEDHLVNKIFEAIKIANKSQVRLDGTWNWPYSRLFSKRSYLRHCIANGGEFCIDCDGKIKPCPGFDLSYGTIDNIEEALRSDTYKTFCKRTVPNIPECRGCEIEGLCGGGCMLNASKVHNGNIFRKSESCYLFRSLFRRSVANYLDGQGSEPNETYSHEK